jgi:tight adherence protein B
MITAMIALVFLAVIFAVFAVYFAIWSVRWSPAAELKRRLRRMAEGETAQQTDLSNSELIRTSTPAENALHRLPLMGRVKRLIEQSGVNITAVRLFVLSLMAAASGFLFVILLSRNTLAALLAMLVLGGIPFFYLAYRKHQRESLFDEQFPDALTMVARSLRAGHALPGAVELVSQEMPEPTGGLFRTAYEQQLLGMRMTDCISNMLEKIDSKDLNFFVTIIRINYETGGNLADILDKLADTVRSRLQIRRQVKVYTAEGRMSGYVLFLLPFCLFFLFYVMNPEYMKVFFSEPTCRLALIAAFIMQCVGFFVIRKMINIRI